MLDLALLLGRGLWWLPKDWSMVCNHCGEHLTFVVVLVLWNMVRNHRRTLLTSVGVLVIQDLV